MIELNATIYKCEWCKKVSLSKSAMKSHQNACLKNPDKKAICYKCVYFVFAGVEEREKVCFEFESVGGITYAYKWMDKHMCCLKNKKLFNGVKMSEPLEVQLLEDDWMRMPTETIGCENFKDNFKEI